jgi:hypothetical protein
LKPPTVDWLRRLGAAYFVTTEWNDLIRSNPQLTSYLGAYAQVPLAGAPAHTVLLDLRRPR